MIVGVVAVAFAMLVAIFSLWALIKMLGSGTAPTFERGNLVRRNERPATFWTIAAGRVLTIAICVWFGAGVIADFNLMGLFNGR